MELIPGKGLGSKMSTGKGREIEVPLPEGIRTFRVVCRPTGRLIGIGHTITTPRETSACVDVFGVQGKMVVSNCRTFDDPRRAVQWMQGQLRGLECDD